MPRKSSTPSLADEQAAPGGAAAVDRALSVLSAFRAGDKALSVTELADRTRLYKSTVLRLLASLAHGGLIRKTTDGLWSLGPEISRLAAVYTASFSLEDVVLPVMQQLVAKTGKAWPCTSSKASSACACSGWTPPSCSGTTSKRVMSCLWTAGLADEC